MDDERFVSDKTKQTYLKKGRLQGKQKIIVEENFLQYYENFEFLRKRKGQKQEIKLGELKDVPTLKQDKRHTNNQATTTRIAIKAITAFLVSIANNSGNYQGDDRFSPYSFQSNKRVILTPFMWMVASELVTYDLKLLYEHLFYNKGYDSNPLLDKVLKEYPKEILKSYSSSRREIIIGKFEDVKKHLPFELVPVIYNGKAQVLDGENKEKFNQFISDLEANSECEKPLPFKKSNAKTKMYKELLDDFLLEEFETFSFFWAYSIDLDKFKSVESLEVSDEEISIFRRILKDRLDAKTIKKQAKGYLASRIENDLLETDNFIGRDHYVTSYDYPMHFEKNRHELGELTLLPRYIALDVEFGFANFRTVSNENENLFHEVLVEILPEIDLQIEVINWNSSSDELSDEDIDYLLNMPMGKERG